MLNIKQLKTNNWHLLQVSLLHLFGVKESLNFGSRQCYGTITRKLDCNSPRSLYQNSNTIPRLSGQNVSSLHMRVLNTKRTKPNADIQPKSLRVVLECCQIKRGLLGKINFNHLHQAYRKPQLFLLSTQGFLDCRHLQTQLLGPQTSVSLVIR